MELVIWCYTYHNVSEVPFLWFGIIPEAISNDMFLIWKIADFFSNTGCS